MLEKGEKEAIVALLLCCCRLMVLLVGVRQKYMRALSFWRASSFLARAL